jgi:hypothetical protein
MSLGFDFGASSVKTVLLDSDDRVIAIAGADPPNQMRAAALEAICKRAWRVETFQPDAARAATFTASRACRGRLALFA